MVRCSLLHGVGRFHLQRVKVNAQQALSHCRHPEVAPVGCLYVEGVGLQVLWELVVGRGIGVNVAEAFCPGAHPDASLAVLRNAHYRCGKRVLEVPDGVLVGVEHVQPVLVGSHPAASLAVYHGADDARLSYDVVLPQLIAHIEEPPLLAGLHIDAFLQHSQPNVAAAVLRNRVYFTSAQIHLAAEVGVVGHAARLWVVNGQSLPVVAYHDVSVALTVESRDVLMGCGFNVLEPAAPGTAHIDAVHRGAHVDVARLVLAHASQRTQLFRGGKVAAHVPAVVFQQTLTAGGHPDVPPAVFQQVLNGVNVFQLAASLPGVLTVLNGQQTVARRSRQYLAVLSDEETGHVARDRVPVQVFHLNVLETAAVVGLQRAVHTHVEQAVLCLGYAVDVIARHAVQLLPVFLDNQRLVAVVPVKTVTSGYPEEPVAV